MFIYKRLIVFWILTIPNLCNVYLQAFNCVLDFDYSKFV